MTRSLLIQENDNGHWIWILYRRIVTFANWIFKDAPVRSPKDVLVFRFSSVNLQMALRCQKLKSIRFSSFCAFRTSSKCSCFLLVMRYVFYRSSIRLIWIPKIPGRSARTLEVFTIRCLRLQASDIAEAEGFAVRLVPTKAHAASPASPVFSC
ncbi:hypothetical protein BV898_17806 [Hypsibius exemplaris]|uniref:Uncharacterized protein n=1 Tax=Hypsibius exemplaris TaxID=2072580 RepID=A0A9X6RME2_HYPEX|nr:hypothetical protein BV898_17806 [Hypsibius exemplaris]